jgi:ATP-dependent exoDNAse (exonuclease V) beta subunit
MSGQNHITVYNASAGSGKTYNLVKSYIKVLIQSEYKNKHRQLLAITFTNKAVAEMKERVLSTLQEFANYKHEDKNTPAMLEDIAKETGLKHKIIARKATSLLHEILHNYAAFDIVTIDTFTHRILRTFSKDLNLSGNFEVSLDVKGLRARAVDRLIDKTGNDKKITLVLVDYALQKTDEDKDWNIARDLNATAALLNNENDAAAITSIQKKNLEDFDILAKLLIKNQEVLVAQIKDKAQNLLNTFTVLGIEDSHFSRKSFYKHVSTLAKDPLNIKYNPKTVWQNQIEDYSFYNKTTDETAKSSIDGIREELISFFKQTKDLYFEVSKLNEFYKNLVPLSTLQLINTELQLIKEEENVLPISDFNAIIHKSLKNQPAAFIYERLGERYTNYFIDEFQDTSILQWENLVPLIDNALVSESKDKTANSLLIVGDPKQAIYRWRGGKAEQFIELTQGITPFTSSPTRLEQLDKNYRSHKEVISFNNSFFTQIAGVFDNPTYADIYTKDNAQKHNALHGGFVSLDFIEDLTNAQADEIYPQKVLDIIEKATQDGFRKSDICILIRSNKQGAHIAQFLAEQHIKVVSSDSLLLKNSSVVSFIHDILLAQDQPDNIPAAIRALRFLADSHQVEDVHVFLETWLHSKDKNLYKYLQSLDIFFSSRTFASLPLYEGVEYIIRSFNLSAQADAFVIGYLETVFNYTATQNQGLIGFLDHWEEKKDSLSISAPLQKDAVQIMTIHKSKGLEFPVVIFPYADAKLYSHQDEHHWYDIEAQDYGGFSQLMVKHADRIKNYGHQGNMRFSQRRGEQQFDALNVLYVACTRAVERLYVLSRFRESVIPQNYGNLLVNYLKDTGLYQEGKMEYRFGEEIKKEIPENHFEQALSIPFISSNKEAHNIQIITKKGRLLSEDVEEAISYGNLIHELLAIIKTPRDIETALQDFLLDGRILEEQKTILRETLITITKHPELTDHFKEGLVVYNERAILSQDGATFIPDRVVVSPNGETTIIDYKTGVPKEEHSYQLDNYASLLGQMDFNVLQKLLVYINEHIKVIQV